MEYEIENLQRLAKEKEEENWRFRTFLKWNCELSDKKLDKQVFEITDSVWSTIDCIACGRCCEELKPAFSKKEQQRLAKRFGLSIEQLREKYLQYDSEDEPVWRTRKIPCSFLDSKKCSIYEDRPQECRDYPYLYKPDFSSRTMGMIERTFTCPVVYSVMEELKNKLDFR
jgi:Fe-S-cluster containining protein